MYIKCLSLRKSLHLHLWSSYIKFVFEFNLKETYALVMTRSMAFGWPFGTELKRWHLYLCDIETEMKFDGMKSRRKFILS